MKKIILAIAAAMCPIVTYAQSTERNYLMIKAGPSIPIGAFGGDDVENDKHGLAKTGGNLEVRFGHLLSNSKIAWLASLKINSLGRNGDPLLKEYAFNDQWKITVDRYNLIGLQGGISYEVLHSRKIEFQLTALTGVHSISYPDTKISFDGGNGNYFSNVANGNRPIGISITLGGIVQFHLTSRLNLICNLDFMATRAMYKVEFTTKTSYGINQVEHETIKQPISVIDAGIGIAYKFKPK